MKFKLNPLTGEFDYTSDSANKEKLNPMTGEFNLVEGDWPFSQIFNPLTWNFNLLGNSTPPVTHTYTMLESVDVLAENIWAYLLVPYKVNYKSKIRAKYMQTANNVPWANVAAAVFWVTNNTPTTNNAYNWFLRLLGWSSSSWFNRVGRGDYTIGTIADCQAEQFPVALNEWYTMYYNLNVVSQDNTGTKTLAEPETDPTWVSERDFALFWRAQPWSWSWDTTVQMPFVWKIAYFSIEEDWVLTLNLIPAKRNSDNAIGFYDTVSWNFYTATNWTFTAWAEICTLDSFYECTGTSAVDLGIKPTDNMSVELHYSVYHNGSIYVFWTRLVDWWNQLLTFSWSMNGWTVTFFVKWVSVAAKTWSTNWTRVGWQNNEYIWKITVTPTQKNFYAKDIINNLEFNETGMNSWSFSSDIPTMRAWWNWREYETSWTKIYDIKITQTIGWVAKKYHFIPSTRVSDDVHWFYEVVSHTFYAAA